MSHDEPDRGVLVAEHPPLNLRWLAATCPSLWPVYDRPLACYGISRLVEAGCREVLLVSTPQDQPRLRDLLGDGRRWGFRLRYERQSRARGARDALQRALRFVGGRACWVGTYQRLLLEPLAKLPEAAPARSEVASGWWRFGPGQLRGWLEEEPTTESVSETDLLPTLPLDHPDRLLSAAQWAGRAGADHPGCVRSAAQRAGRLDEAQAQRAVRLGG